VILKDDDTIELGEGYLESAWAAHADGARWRKLFDVVRPRTVGDLKKLEAIASPLFKYGQCDHLRWAFTAGPGEPGYHSFRINGRYHDDELERKRA